MNRDLPTELGAAAACGACLQAAGLAGDLAVPLGAALAAGLGWLLRVGLPAAWAAWQARRAARARLAEAQALETLAADIEAEAPPPEH